MKKTILILSNSRLESDPRILKQIHALKDDFKIITAGYSPSEVKEVSKDLGILKPMFYKAGFLKKCYSLFLLFFKLYKRYYWNKSNLGAFEGLKSEKFDGIIANEINTLPLADKLAQLNDCFIYCDFHEYYFGTKGKIWMSKLTLGYNHWLLLNHKNRIKTYSAVSKGIINLYKEQFDIDCTWVDNSCKYYDLHPSSISANKIKMVTHGASIRDRKLELMIDVVSFLDDRFVLDMYLMSKDKVYINELKQKAKELTPNRVNIYEGIPFYQIQETINKYDIGLYILFPTNINNKLALPNKLFEFIQGRIAVAIGPSSEMAGIVNDYNIGVVADNFSPENLAQKLNSLNVSDIEKYKNNTNVAAKERNAENNLVLINKIIQNCVKRR